MKKITQLLIFLFIASGVFAQNGVIREISGSVELKHTATAGFVAAAVGDLIAQDTVVSTGFKSTALVEVGSTVIALRPLTRLTLKEISASAGEETLNVNLQAGRVRVDVNPPAGAKASMTISSPSATASVRGTGFDFDGRNLNVNDGVVDFTGDRDGLPKPVNAGFVSGITADGKAADPLYTGRSNDSDLQPPGPSGSDPSSDPASLNSGAPIVDTPPVDPPPVDPPPVDPPPVDPPPVDPPPVDPPPVDPPPPPPPPSTGDIDITVKYE